MKTNTKVIQNPEEKRKRLYKRHKALMMKQISTKQQIRFLQRCQKHPDIIPKGLKIRTLTITKMDWTGTRLKNQLEQRQAITMIRKKRAEKGPRAIQIERIVKDIEWMEGNKRRWNADQKDDELFKMQEEKEKRRLCKKFADLVNWRKDEKKVERSREERNIVRKREAKMRCGKTIVYNRSSHELSKEMMSVLQLGLNFVPTPKKVSCIDVVVSTEGTCAGTRRKDQDGDNEEGNRN